MEPIIIESRISKNLGENQQYFDEKLRVGMNYDMLTSKLQIAGKSAVLYYINGMYKDELMQKVLQYLFSVKSEEMPRSASEFLQNNIPCTEVELEDRKEKILINILAGQIALLVDGFDKCFVFDARQFPTRGVEEPPKDKTLRGSKDGFVETIVSNTALIRRRIRDTDLCIEMMQAGESSHTDIAVCYMANRVDHDFLYDLKSRIKGLHVDALSMNQQSLAESLYEKHWFNPFPKYRYSERPDTTAAQILEGNIVIFVDNAPQAMILPTSLFDITDLAISLSTSKPCLTRSIGAKKISCWVLLFLLSFCTWEVPILSGSKKKQFTARVLIKHLPVHDEESYFTSFSLNSTPVA